MALGATIYRAVIDVSDLDRGYYGTRTLTIARHPSETESRMMVRILRMRFMLEKGLNSDEDFRLKARLRCGKSMTQETSAGGLK